MMAVITAMEFPRDLQGAEAMMSRWKEHRAEVDSRKEAVKKFLDSGQTMIDDKHFLSEEVSEVRNISFPKRLVKLELKFRSLIALIQIPFKFLSS